MLLFIGGAVAGVIGLIIICVLVAGSSDTRHQPYAGTPAWHPSHQSARLGAVSLSSDFEQTKLSRSLEVRTSSAYVKYTVEGPPDAVLQDQPFMSAIATAMVQASSTDSYLSVLQGRVNAASAGLPIYDQRAALPGRTDSYVTGYQDYQVPVHSATFAWEEPRYDGR